MRCPKCGQRMYVEILSAVNRGGARAAVAVGLSRAAGCGSMR